jgi:hypothetical protein
LINNINLYKNNNIYNTKDYILILILLIIVKIIVFITQIILFLIPRIFRTQIIIFFKLKLWIVIKIIILYTNINIFDMNMLNYKKNNNI